MIFQKIGCYSVPHEKCCSRSGDRFISYARVKRPLGWIIDKYRLGCYRISEETFKFKEFLRQLFPIALLIYFLFEKDYFYDR